MYYQIGNISPARGTQDWKGTPKSPKVIPAIVQEISSARSFLRMMIPHP